MAAPINSSALLQIDNDGGGVTFNAGFTFTAGRDAVLTLGHFATAQSISGVTIGGTTATLISSANKVSGSENSARIYLAQNIAGGTADVVITYSGGTDHFISGSVEEWAAGVLESSAVDTGTANSAAGTSTSPSVSTAATTSQANTIVYAVLVTNSTSTNNNITGPTGYTVTWTEQDSTNHEGGRGAWKEETTTGTKTATFGMINDGWGVAIVALKLASSAPVITSQPADQTVNNGATATFSVTATGATSYQWQDNSSGSFADISGATSSSYVTSAATYSMQGRLYRCVVTNAGGSTNSNSAQLRVAFNLTGTGPRAYPTPGGLIGAGTVDAWLRGTDAGGGGSSGPVGASTETDTAFALGSARPAGLSAETDTAFARAGVLIRATGLSTETDTALALTPRQLRAVGLSTETDTALALSGVQLRAVGLATETDTALALSASVGTAVGLASETDTALALAARQIRATGLATETDTALALSAAAGNQVGLAVEVDTALAPAGVQIRAVGLAAETDTALARGAVQIRSAGISLETDSALALSARQILGTGLASETDTALQLSAGGAAAVGLATETDTALALAGVTIPQIVIPQTSFAEFSGAVVKTKAEPKKPRVKAPKPAKRVEVKPLDPVLLPVGLAIEQTEALSLESWVIQRGLMRTAPVGPYPKLMRDSCPHCGAPAAHRHQ